MTAPGQDDQARSPAKPTVLSLFSGYSGLDMAVEQVTGASTRWHAEVDPAASAVLAYRYPDIPNLGDVTAVDWSSVDADVICGGSPCQDVSTAGRRRGMRAGTRSGLWASMCDAIDIIRPQLVVWENVRGVLSAEADSALEPCPGCVGDGTDGAVLRALGRVLGDLADLGYDASWYGLRAADVGAPHGRFRVFVAAWDATDGGRRDARLESQRGKPARPARGPDLAAADADGDAGLEGVTRSDKRHIPNGDGQGVRGDGRTAADTDDSGSQGSQPAGGRHMPDGGTATHAAGNGRDEGWPESAGFVGGPDAAERSATTPDADDHAAGDGRPGRNPCRSGTESAQRGGAITHADSDTVRIESVPEPRRGCEAVTRWGSYEPAIQRWERTIGRPAPSPTEVNTKGGQRLSPRFVEWMMGLPAGWVTDVPGISRNDQLKMLGNGVVPQQAAAALGALLGVGV